MHDSVDCKGNARMHGSADEVTATVRVQYEEPVQAHCGCGYSSVAPRHTSASRRDSQVRSAVALVLLSLLAVLLLAYGGNVDFSHRRGIVSTEAGWLEESWVHGNPGSPAGPWEAKPSPRYPSSSDWPSRVVIDLAKTCGADNRLPCETWQSSTAKDAVASRALETDDKCTLTQLQNNPWWMVDLGRQATVKGLALRGHEFVEVDNLARSCGENKDDACIATQSSTEQSGEASRAVDGDINGQFEAGSVTHTAGDANPWWRLDFGRQVQVSALKVYGRRDCCADRLQGFDVYVGDNATQPNANEACATNQDQPPTPSIDTETNMYSDVSCDTALKGRYLWIQKPGAAGSILSLAEVQVSGYVVRSRLSFLHSFSRPLSLSFPPPSLPPLMHFWVGLVCVWLCTYW